MSCRDCDERRKLIDKAMVNIFAKMSPPWWKTKRYEKRDEKDQKRQDQQETRS